MRRERITKKPGVLMPGALNVIVDHSKFERTEMSELNYILRYDKGAKVKFDDDMAQYGNNFLTVAMCDNIVGKLGIRVIIEIPSIGAWYDAHQSHIGSYPNHNDYEYPENLTFKKMHSEVNPLIKMDELKKQITLHNFHFWDGSFITTEGNEIYLQTSLFNQNFQIYIGRVYTNPNTDFQLGFDIPSPKEYQTLTAYVKSSFNWFQNSIISETVTDGEIIKYEIDKFKKLEFVSSYGSRITGKSIFGLQIDEPHLIILDYGYKI